MTPFEGRAARSVVAALLLAGGCGTPPSPSPAPQPASTLLPDAVVSPPPPVGPSAAPEGSASAPVALEGLPPDDVCAGSKPVPHPFSGVLRKARCEQEMFLTMAWTAEQLGVECRFCHVPLPTNPKKEDYPVDTTRKQTANWMNMHLMQALKPADGSPFKCKSCHVDDRGKPLLKILGNPRDPDKAHEWMSIVMVNRFVTTKGEKLKCKSCHVGNVGTPQWHAKVILRSDQLPAH